MKKRIASIILVLATAALFAPSRPAAKSMGVDTYYNSFIIWSKKGTDWLIEREAAGDGTIRWKTRGTTGAFNVIVDLANGYLQYTTGCSCHPEIVSCAIFSAKGNDMYISFSSNKLKFYKYLGSGNWRDETRAVVPELSWRAFAGGSAPPDRELLDHTIINYTVPRVGTTVIAEIVLYSKHQDDPGRFEETQKLMQALQPRFTKAFRYRSIELRWSKEKAKLTVGGKKPAAGPSR